jgi:hypothetical protein
VTINLQIQLGDLIFLLTLFGSIAYGIGHFIGDRSGEKTGRMLGEMDERIRRMREEQKKGRDR